MSLVVRWHTVSFAIFTIVFISCLLYAEIKGLETNTVFFQFVKWTIDYIHASSNSWREILKIAFGSTNVRAAKKFDYLFFWKLLNEAYDLDIKLGIIVILTLQPILKLPPGLYPCFFNHPSQIHQLSDVPVSHIHGFSHVLQLFNYC